MSRAPTAEVHSRAQQQLDLQLQLFPAERPSSPEQLRGEQN